MKFIRAARRQGKRALAGHRREAAALLLLWGMMWGLVSLADRGAYRLAGFPPGGSPSWEAAAVTAITLALREVLLAPLGAGASAWFAALAGGWTRPVTTIFWAYGNRVWLRSLGVRLTTGFLTGAVTLIPLAGEGFSLWLLRERLAALPPRDRELALAGAGAAALLWLLVSRAYAQRFAMARFLLGPDYGYSAAKAIDLSVEYTRGYRWRLVGLELSFLPWFAACLLILPALWVLPWYASCRAKSFVFLCRRAGRISAQVQRAAPREVCRRSVRV